MGTTENQAAYIQPIKLDDLEKSIDAEHNTKYDFCPEKLIQAEMDYIRAWREERDSKLDDDDTKLTGLALSGGGIRSATFSLGVMQALANRDLLKRIDYLSTVSGGGYIGSALTWLLSNKSYDDYTATNNQENSEKQADDVKKTMPRFDLGAKNFPYGTDDPDPAKAKQAKEPQRRMLQYLREHGYYLTPGAGINALSLLGVVLRGTFLNVAMWMPVFILFFVLGMLFFGVFHPDEMFVLPEIMSAENMKPFGGVDPRLFGFELFLWLGLGLAVLLLSMTLFYSFLTWFRRGYAGWWYQKRRIVETWVPILLVSIALFILVGSMPVIADYLKNAWVSVGPAAMLSGLVLAMRDFIKPADDSNSDSSGLLAPLAAGLFVFGGFLIAYELAYGMIDKEWLISAVLGMILFSLFFGWFVNLNYISIHRYYRDRLMETFMPDIFKALGNETGAAQGANTAKLSDFACRDKDASPHSPYHIVNTNVVLVDSNKRIYSSRGGDSFILSPLYCGSNATGWCSTEEFLGGKMTLATAVAISGAAANPNTGVGGVGLTRNRLVSFVMALLNLKLGYWAEHPDPDNCLRSKHLPNHFHPGLYHFGNLIGWKGFREQSAFLQLSDGGHFENTGMYELIRRHTKLIIVCDGGADAEFSFSDFQTTVRRIEDDFGARVKVLDKASPDQMVPVPKEGEDDSGVYPKDAKFAKQGHMMARIMYADGSEGWIIFLKTTLIDEVSFKVKGYAAQNKDFPDQSTADQFFDEVQFEAYRELGYRLTIKMLESQVPQGVTCVGLSISKAETKAESVQTLEEFIKTCSETV